MNDNGAWLVAVDDDPTGCQSVSGVPLLTAWDHGTLVAAARRRAPVTFVLTNSRSHPQAEAVAVNRDVGAALAAAADEVGVRLRLISRSDSTLRGHYPAEVDALVAGAGLVPDAVVLCPAFFEAGRFTADGIHWVHLDGELIPACDTEFARDATFGFTELTLADWARARGAPAEVIDIGLVTLARGDEEAVVSALRAARGGQAVVLNATNYGHLATFDSAARTAEAAGTTIVYRTGPSYVRAAAGLGRPAVADLGPAPTDGGAGGHGLVVVGSHTALTTAQVEGAVGAHGLDVIELDVGAVLDPARVDDHVARVAEAVAASLHRQATVLRTSRVLVSEHPDLDPLEISRQVADAVTATVRRVAELVPPAWVVVKGGVTSHDVLARAFDVRSAEVAGQALPGIIPVLRIPLGPAGELRPYVIFPGNVGDERTLAQVVARLVGR
ncbi:MAG: hypothetical protein OEW29_11435 [Acidimicrobiia bacterium]|nr:hypothetical protein [Acidimicrobiia bacterium]